MFESKFDNLSNKQDYLGFISMSYNSTQTQTGIIMFTEANPPCPVLVMGNSPQGAYIEAMMIRGNAQFNGMFTNNMQQLRQLDLDNKVNLLSYTSKNPYTTTKEGVIHCFCSYSANKYTMVYDKNTQSVLSPYVEVSTPTNASATGNVSNTAAAYVGMQLYGKSNDSYGKCYFIPFK